MRKSRRGSTGGDLRVRPAGGEHSVLGPPGAEKSHLATGLAIRAAEQGRRVYCGSPGDPVGSLQETETKGQLQRRLGVLTYPALLVVDEMGCLPVTRNRATLFFQLINERYERASTVPTSNTGFEEWGATLGDLLDCERESDRCRGVRRLPRRRGG